VTKFEVRRTESLTKRVLVEIQTIRTYHLFRSYDWAPKYKGDVALASAGGSKPGLTVINLCTKCEYPSPPVTKIGKATQNVDNWVVKGS